MKILFVEDNAHTAQAMKLMLELRGFSVDTVAGVAEAVSGLASTGYDLLISDMNLPDGTGYDILTQAAGFIPAIAISGNTTDEDRSEAADRGFLEYLTKPFQLDELTAAIGRVMDAKT